MKKTKDHTSTSLVSDFKYAIRFVLVLCCLSAFTFAEHSESDETTCHQLLEAVLKEDIQSVNALLSIEADPNCSEYLVVSYPLPKGGKVRVGGILSPLTLAAQTGNLPIGRLLLEKGAEVNHHSEEEQTPLMAASARGHLDFVKFLVKHGADINITVTDVGNALSLASSNEQKHVVAFLLKQKEISKGNY
ncbi:ankyrin repeat domain-containing protein [Roseivirga sp. BDSF3-8]|uniref:ankyrin repeat domain-containing protein n=1 Tax=Roseivirga sp. BDSF3-8 TaxID=3241598 RepID=UPI00353273C4